MKKLLPALIIFFLLYPLGGLCLDIPETLRQETDQAMINGRALYEVYLKGSVVDQVAEKEKSKIDTFCGLQYKNYRAGTHIYFIAEPPPKGGIVFGRHYTIIGDRVITSTVSCFVIPPPAAKSVGAYTTHLLTDTPTEFHVFLSLKHKSAIFVGTKSNTWKVDQGVINLLEEKK